MSLTSGRFWRVAGTVLLLACTLLALKATSERPPDTLAQPLYTIPQSVDGWLGRDNPALDKPILDVLSPTSYLDRSYSRGALQLSLFVAYYAQQRAGEAMHSPKNCLPGAGWEIWNYGSARVPVDGHDYTINRYSIQNNGMRLVVLYWYQSKHRIVASEYLGKVMLLRDSLLRGSTAGSIVRITVADDPQSVQAGINFSGNVIREVRRCFGGSL